MNDGQAVIEGDEIVIRLSISGLAELISDETLDEADTVSEEFLRCRRRLSDMGSIALAEAFVEELNRENCCLIDTMIGEAIEGLGAV